MISEYLFAQALDDTSQMSVGYGQPNYWNEMSRGTVRHEMSGHMRSLQRYAYVLTRNHADAEDLVQETLIKALAAADSFRAGAEMRPWLFRIMHNAHVSAGRKTRRHKAYAEKQALEEPPAQPASQVQRLEVKATLAALQRLPEHQREAVALIAFEDMSYVDAAKVVGVPLGTFMSRISRGREALRRLLDADVESARAVRKPA